MSIFFLWKRWFFLLVMFAVVLLSAACAKSVSSPPSNQNHDATQHGKSAESLATPKVPTSIEEIAVYEGADRQQRLLDGAKKEGTFNLYTAMPLEDIQMITDAFEKKYGVKVTTWRSSGENLIQRITTEAQAKKFEFDIVDTDGIGLEALHREKLLQQVKSPYFKDLIDPAVLPHKEWVGTRLNVFVQAYNTEKVKKEELPQKWEDLLDPKWKGRLGIEAEDLDWFASISKELGEEKSLNLFKEIVSTNGISVRKGHTLLTNLVASGEIPIALTVYNYKPEQLKMKGAPIDWYVINPAIARPNGVAISRKAPHPNAAMLFYDFMISDAQELLLKRDFVPTNKKIDTKLNKIPMKFVDPAIILDDNAKWSKLYDDIIVKRGSK
jgi:iron(III) transport system substrate-binding protein